MDIYMNLIFGIFVVISLIWLGWKLRLVWKNFLFFFTKRKGRVGENKAKKLLKSHGYKIIQSQISISGCLYVDGEQLDFSVRPDYLVEHEGIAYLAEVKTGDAAEVSNRATRRQLFEYSRLGVADTIILVNATLGTVQQIRFYD